MTFTLMPRKVEERVPAREVCANCGGKGIFAPCQHVGCHNHISHPCECCGRIQGKCKVCQGSGGKWHEAMYFNKITPDVPRIDLGDNYPTEERYIPITKSSFLVREWDVCKECHATGNKHCEPCNGQGGYLDEWIMTQWCRHCDGEGYIPDGCESCGGTGAEPGTASPWRVE